MNKNPIPNTLAGVTVGLETSFENLTMFPLLAREHCESHSAVDYQLLDKALASGVTEITEVSEGGSVPELLVLNRGAEPVLIVDGEELVGAKQNRIVNLTILVAPNSNLTIPVSCVEAGRWRSRSRAFASSPYAQYATGRAKRMKQVTESMNERWLYMSDQAAVWSDIAAKSERMRTSSPTSAMEAMFLGHTASIEKFVAACQPFDEQVGALFAIGGTTVCLDLFDRPSTLRRMLPKLVRSIAVDAIDRRNNESTSYSSQTMRAEADRFLGVLAAATHRQSQSVGLGTDVRLSSSGIAGAALVMDQRVLHLSAFSQEALA